MLNISGHSEVKEGGNFEKNKKLFMVNKHGELIKQTLTSQNDLDASEISLQEL